MVAERDEIDAVAQQLIIDLRREAGSPGSILDIGDDTVDGLFSHEGLQSVGQNSPTRAAYYIADA
jgi:hypothetical protein